MWELITHPSNIVFSISLCLMLCFSSLEILLVSLGGNSQGFFDYFLPEESSNSTSQQHSSFLSPYLAWIYLGRIPFFIWISILLSTYGLLGLFIQHTAQQITTHTFSAWLISPVCFVLCLPIVRYMSKFMGKLLIEKESAALKDEELLGHTATIILADAKLNAPAQAKVRDKRGQNHYVLVEAEHDEILRRGQAVVLSRRTKSGFRGFVV